jgi:C4-dicarboxylate-specific signal transduction histidine kinase
MTADSTAVVAGVIGAAGAIVAALIAGWLVRRRTTAETADILTQAAERLMARYETQVQALERRVEHAEAQFLRCEHARHEDRLLMEQLEAQMRELQERLDDQGE